MGSKVTGLSKVLQLQEWNLEVVQEQMSLNLEKWNFSPLVTTKHKVFHKSMPGLVFF